MYALFNSFSPQIFDRLFDKINKYFEHVFKSYFLCVRGKDIDSEIEQNFTSKMILLKNVSAFKSINTRKKQKIYIYMYITKNDDIQRKIYNQSMEYFLRTQFVFE